MAIRFDRGTLRKPERLSDGSLRVDAVISRAGIFEYRNPDGSMRTEYRPPKEVFRQDSLDSALGKAVTDDHPWYEEDGLVTIANREKLQRGFVFEKVRRDGNDVVATLIITSPSLIAKLEAGETGVSCGYEQDLLETPGTTPEGVRFDAQQTNIHYNHVALAVDVPRAGDAARVRMDSAIMIAGDTGKEMAMEELKKALAELAAQTVKNGELQSRLDAANAEIEKSKKAATEAQARFDSVTAERDAAKEAAAKSEKTRLDSEGSMMERARARIKLEETASKHLRNDAGEPDDVSKKSDAEIRAALVEKITGKSMEGKSEAYVSARLDAALETVTEGEDAMADVRRAADETTRMDSTGNVAEKARNEWLKREHNRYENAGKKGA